MKSEQFRVVWLVSLLHSINSTLLQQKTPAKDDKSQYLTASARLLFELEKMKDQFSQQPSSTWKTLKQTLTPIAEGTTCNLTVELLVATSHSMQTAMCMADSIRDLVLSIHNATANKNKQLDAGRSKGSSAGNQLFKQFKKALKQKAVVIQKAQSVNSNTMRVFLDKLSEHISKFGEGVVIAPFQVPGEEFTGFRGELDVLTYLKNSWLADVNDDVLENIRKHLNLGVLLILRENSVKTKRNSDFTNNLRIGDSENDIIPRDSLTFMKPSKKQRHVNVETKMYKTSMKTKRRKTHPTRDSVNSIQIYEMQFKARDDYKSLTAEEC